MRRITVIIIGILFFGFLVWLGGNIVYCARGCNSGYKNFFDVTSYEKNEGKEDQSTVFVISSDIVMNDGSSTIVIHSVLFECKYKDRQSGKKKSFEFRYDPKNNEGKDFVIQSNSPGFNAVGLELALSHESLYTYMQFNDKYGSIQSIKLKDISFTSYALESDNFPAWKGYFDPINTGFSSFFGKGGAL